MSDNVTCPDCGRPHGDLPPVLGIVGQPFDRFDCLHLAVERMRPVVEAARKRLALSRAIEAKFYENGKLATGEAVLAFDAADRALVAALDTFDRKDPNHG